MIAAQADDLLQTNFERAAFKLEAPSKQHPECI